MGAAMGQQAFESWQRVISLLHFDRTCARPNKALQLAWWSSMGCQIRNFLLATGRVPAVLPGSAPVGRCVQIVGAFLGTGGGLAQSLGAGGLSCAPRLDASFSLEWLGNL